LDIFFLSGFRRFVASLLVLIIPVLVAAGGTAWGNSAKKSVAKGNAAYAHGKYDDALAAYKEAATDAPESPRIYFNKGAAYYRKGDYTKAVDAFEKAAAKSRDTGLEARSKFNLGNSMFRESERQRGSDTKKSLAACAKSIQYYQEALKLRPDFREAAENVEIVRLTLKSILDQIKKQEEAQKKERRARKKTMKKLRDLIKRQEDAAKKTRSLAGEKMRKKGGAQWKDQVRDRAMDQKKIRDETRDLAGKLVPSKGKPATPNPAKKHLRGAVREQGTAMRKLERNRAGEALPSQEKAAGELKEALKALNAGGQNKRGKGNQGRDRHPTQGQKKSSPQSEARAGKGQKKPPKPATAQKKDQPPMAALPDEARDILNEERKNNGRRRLPMAGGYRPVEKDW